MDRACDGKIVPCSASQSPHPSLATKKEASHETVHFTLSEDTKPQS